jgi:hypothetical protein
MISRVDAMRAVTDLWASRKIIGGDMTCRAVVKVLDELPEAQPVLEANFSDAPIWYSSEQADAWASGYNASRHAAVQADREEVMPSERTSSDRPADEGPGDQDAVAGAALDAAVMAERERCVHIVELLQGVADERGWKDRDTQTRRIVAAIREEIIRDR